MSMRCLLLDFNSRLWCRLEQIVHPALSLHLRSNRWSSRLSFLNLLQVRMWCCPQQNSQTVFLLATWDLTVVGLAAIRLLGSRWLVVLCPAMVNDSITRNGFSKKFANCSYVGSWVNFPSFCAQKHRESLSNFWTKWYKIKTLQLSTGWFIFHRTLMLSAVRYRLLPLRWWLTLIDAYSGPLGCTGFRESLIWKGRGMLPILCILPKNTVTQWAVRWDRLG